MRNLTAGGDGCGGLEKTEEGWEGEESTGTVARAGCGATAAGAAASAGGLHFQSRSGDFVGPSREGRL